MIANRDNITVDDHSEKELNPTSVRELAEIYKKNPTTAGINFNYNYIGDEGMDAIASIINNCHNLKILRLQYNSITDEGIKNFLEIEGVKKNLPKLAIELANNQIHDEGLLLIRDFLSPQSMLSLLNGNIILDDKLYEECRANAVKALQENTNLSDNINRTFQEGKGKEHFLEETKTNESEIKPPPKIS